MGQNTKLHHFYNLADFSSDQIRRLLRSASELKSQSHSDELAGKQFALVFLAPSLRTRSSFEVAIRQMGGGVTTLEPSMFYGLEFEEGVRMDGVAAEHVREAVPVLSGFFSGLGLRLMASGDSRESDLRDLKWRLFANYATVPVFNMESALYHPCQVLADLLTIHERLGGYQGHRITITWAPHPRPLPTAVPNSLLLGTAQVGMDVTLAYPDGFDLPSGVLEHAEELARTAGGAVRVVHDQKVAVEGAEILYAKSWGALSRYETPDEEGRLRAAHADWMVDERLMRRTREACFMHCLPVRRNVVVTDAVLNSSRSLIREQAWNRLHGQKAVLRWLYGRSDADPAFQNNP